MVFEPVSAANKKDWVYRGSDADGSAAGTVGLPKSRWERKGYTIAAQELPKGYPRATQGIPKGYPRDTQGIPKGTTRSHHRSNPGSTPWRFGVPETSKRMLGGRGSERPGWPVFPCWVLPLPGTVLAWGVRRCGAGFRAVIEISSA